MDSESNLPSASALGETDFEKLEPRNRRGRGWLCDTVGGGGFGFTLLSMLEMLFFPLFMNILRFQTYFCFVFREHFCVSMCAKAGKRMGFFSRLTCASNGKEQLNGQKK